MRVNAGRVEDQGILLVRALWQSQNVESAAEIRRLHHFGSRAWIQQDQRADAKEPSVANMAE